MKEFLNKLKFWRASWLHKRKAKQQAEAALRAREMFTLSERNGEVYVLCDSLPICNPNISSSKRLFPSWKNTAKMRWITSNSPKLIRDASLAFRNTPNFAPNAKDEYFIASEV